jgi:hypothetical protein
MGDVDIDATVGVRTQHYVHDVVPLGGTKGATSYSAGPAFKFEAGAIEGPRASRPGSV